LSKSPFQMRGVSIPLTRAAPLESEIACTRAAVAEIAPQWAELWAAAPRPRSPFLGPAWHLAWWRRIAAGTPEIVLLRGAGRPVALAALARAGDGLVGSGGDDLTDVADVLAEDEEAARGLAAAVASRAGRLELSYVPDGARALGPFADELASRGFAVSVEPLVVSPRVRLGRSFDDHVAALGRKDRHELRRKLRRLEAAGTVTYRYAADVGESLERFVAFHRATPGEKGTFLTTSRESFFRDVAAAGAHEGWLRLGELAVGDHVVAVLFGIEQDGVLAAYNSAVDPGAADLSPGVLLHAHAIRDAIARGLDTYDFLRGDERYKYDLGGTAVQLHRLVAVRR